MITEIARQATHAVETGAATGLLPPHPLFPRNWIGFPAANLAKSATLRPIGSAHPDAMLADMERRLLAAVNKSGFGPMGTGGDTTALVTVTAGFEWE